jgi:hypothetical protein
MYNIKFDISSEGKIINLKIVNKSK